jgi:lysyl-tRNA synthetase class 1
MADPTAQAGLKEELAQAIKEMDTRTSSFSETEVFDKLRGVLGNKQVPPEDFTAYLGESNAFFFSPKRKDDAPFPGYFQPLMWFTAADGSTVYGPDPATLTPSALALWRAHLQECAHPVLRARYADLLWEFQKQVDGTKPPLQYAQTAMDAYLAAAAQADATSHEVVVWLDRAIGIATSVGDHARLAAGVQQAIAWVQGTEAAQNARSYVFLFEAIYDNKRVAASEKTAVIAYLETVLTATTDQSGTKFDHATAEIVADLLATQFRRSNNKADAERVIRAAGLATEFAASQASAGTLSELQHERRCGPRPSRGSPSRNGLG